jgi:hypothetical protein
MRSSAEQLHHVASRRIRKYFEHIHY